MEWYHNGTMLSMIYFSVSFTLTAGLTGKAERLVGVETFIIACLNTNLILLTRIQLLRPLMQ